MKKNTAGQKWRVFAFTLSTGAPVTGDAANITAKLSIDYGAATALGDLHPTETEDGFYLFDLTQAETNGDSLDIYPESSSSGVQVIGAPGHESPDSIAAAPAIVPGDGSYVANLLARRAAISLELATLTSASAQAGAKPNLTHTDGGTAVDHQGYKKALYDELAMIDKLILAAPEVEDGGPFEIATQVVT